MAGPAGAPIDGGGAAPIRERVPFDAVLADAHDQEARRLERYRTRWILQHIVLALVSVAVIAACVPSLVDSNEGRGGGFAIAVFLTGGWLGYIAVMAAVSGAAMVMVLATWRIAGIVRADDLGAYERAHAPWWAERSR
ncbi:MAG: hypothetical protein ACTHN0_08825 [Aquihabitans sp.]